MSTPLATVHRNRLQSLTTQAREAATAACRSALENLAVHEGDYRPHMTVDQRQLRNRLRARARALGDARDERSGRQDLKRLAEEAAYEHWHRLLFTRFLAENHLLITDDANGNVPVTLDECEELAAELGARDGFDLACRFASATLPGVFRRDDPVLELVFPANDRKTLGDLLDTIPPDVFTASDSLGWTYQFWQTARKQEVNASGKKIGAEELPAVTQLFTEDYMVDFLLDNTLGAWHAGKVLAANPKLAETAQSEEELRRAVSLPGCPWGYLRFIKGENGTWTPAAGTFDGWPKTAAELKCLDPCMGSGHFVVALFERLVALRIAEEKLDEKTAVAAVIRDNLFGLEIDPRCTQIAAFNLALAAWRRVGHCQLPALNLACSGLAPNARVADWLALADDDEKLRNGMERLYRLFKQAAVLGSLINPRAGGGDLLEADFHELQPLLEQALAQETKDDTAHEMAVTARGVAKAAEILAGQFTLVATNVPYLGRGKQDEVLADYCERVHPDAKADLATCFIERSLTFCARDGSTALITPQNWLFLKRYKRLRQDILTRSQVNAVGRLGAGAFETIGGEVVNVALVVSSSAKPCDNQFIASVSAESDNTPQAKARRLSIVDFLMLKQAEQLRNPDSAIIAAELSDQTLLKNYADSYQGIGTSDNAQFLFTFWEHPLISDRWRTVQTAAAQGGIVGGLHFILPWEGGLGRYYRHAMALKAEGRLGGWKSGGEAWGKRGIAINVTSSLFANFYGGDMFDTTVAVIVPRDEGHIAAILACVHDPTYLANLRIVDQALSITEHTLLKVPFDLAHWQKVAAEKYPHGLPKPFSRDPTQWLFNGHPAGADQPLHVAVARLLGYQWPRQTGSSFPDCPALGPDGLEKLADDDGIVCLAPLNREQPAAQRLRALLHAALGEFNERDLIRQSGPKGSTKTSLEDWLRDDFFAQHCAIFHNRPFIWHLWDGLKDGFHVLVNYHQLDHAKLKALAYTYLGDWIRDQDAGAKANTPGAAERLGAAKKLQAKLIAILDGEAPLDLFVRWKPLHQQAIGWRPDLNDGVRLNSRPFLLAGDVGAKGAGLFRAKPGIEFKPKPDRGTEPLRDKVDYPWFWCAEDPGVDPDGGQEFAGRRWNTAHFTLARK
ncbi:MAG: hypothetical protein RLZZ09_1604, partial [Pseudomonadota bacterium]